MAVQRIAPRVPENRTSMPPAEPEVLEVQLIDPVSQPASANRLAVTSTWDPRRSRPCLPHAAVSCLTSRGTQSIGRPPVTAIRAPEM